MNIGRRIQLEKPDFSLEWRSWSGGHGGDEYGNCSVYFRCFLFGVVIFWDPHFQRKAELPLDNMLQEYETETKRWRRWYSEKFENGEDLWA